MSTKHLMATVFQLLEVRYSHPRRYPHFKVYTVQLSLFRSLSTAEDYLGTYVQNPVNREDVYAFYIREVPLDVPAPGYECVSERVYGQDGKMIDYRDFSSVGECCGVFLGRTPERMRFKVGDIVEILGMDEVRLAFVAGLPLSKDDVQNSLAKQGNGRIIPWDETDDTYTVYPYPFDSFHQHTDALRVFSPHFRIPESLRLKIVNAIESWKDGTL